MSDIRAEITPGSYAKQKESLTAMYLPSTP